MDLGVLERAQDILLLAATYSAQHEVGPGLNDPMIELAAQP
jgi:hypothetical protein